MNCKKCGKDTNSTTTVFELCLECFGDLDISGAIIKPSDKLAEFDKIVSQMREIMVKKNHDYGDDNISALGPKGVFVRIWDKTSRLKQLEWLEKEPKVNESIEDTTLDLANYAIINLILLRGKWK